MIKIIPTSNGALVEFETHKEVYRFEEATLEDTKQIVEMLYSIVEELFPTTRYDVFRAKILVSHGDKYECLTQKNCGICRRKIE